MTNISMVQTAAMWLLGCGKLEKGPSGGLLTKTGKRLYGGLEKEKGKFHFDLLGEVSELPIN